MMYLDVSPQCHIKVDNVVVFEDNIIELLSKIKYRNDSKRQISWNRIDLTLRAPRKNASEQWRLLKSSAANNCLT